MKAAIIGCGLIGRKRAQALRGADVAVCCDLNRERAEDLARDFHARATTDWQEAASAADVDVVFVATTHDMLPRVSEAAAAGGKHVLIEKPGARKAEELEGVLAAAGQTGALVRIGFNHRYHRAFQKAREIFDSGSLGELMFLRARYGHGGRIGYDKEWRANPDISGGGEGIDQGVHLVDLARWFLGDFPHVDGHSATYYWDMPVDDNSFYLLRTGRNQAAFLHASCTEWKNTFSFEIYGRQAKLEISGLGGSYGVERLAYYQMGPALGPPETTIFEYPMADDSWAREWQAFAEDIRTGRRPSPGVRDAQAALQIIEEVYRKSATVIAGPVSGNSTPRLSGNDIRSVAPYLRHSTGD
jgi:predicted dehydrogenase